jgi:hypothetical protein
MLNTERKPVSLGEMLSDSDESDTGRIGCRD